MRLNKKLVQEIKDTFSFDYAEGGSLWRNMKSGDIKEVPLGTVTVSLNGKRIPIDAILAVFDIERTYGYQGIGMGK